MQFLIIKAGKTLAHSGLRGGLFIVSRDFPEFFYKAVTPVISGTLKEAKEYVRQFGGKVKRLS